MTNPAYELASIFEGWTYGGGRASAQRARVAYAKDRGMTQSEVIRAGMRCIVEIEQRVSELKDHGVDVTPFEYALPQWQASLVSASQTTTQSVPSNEVPAVPVDQVMHLRTFGALLEARAAALTVVPAVAERVEAAIAEAEEFVENAQLSDATRLYLLALLARIRAALRDGHPAEFRAAFNEFVGAVEVVQRTAPEADKPNWSRLRDLLIAPVIAGAAGDLLAQGVTHVAGLLGS